jgi:hypothetical protein
MAARAGGAPLMIILRPAPLALALRVAALLREAALA